MTMYYNQRASALKRSEVEDLAAQRFQVPISGEGGGRNINWTKTLLPEAIQQTSPDPMFPWPKPLAPVCYAPGLGISLFHTK